MNLKESNGLRELKPEPGFLLRRKGDSDNFSEVVYLGVNDSADNYEELPAEEAALILREGAQVCDTDYEDLSDR